MPAVHSTAQHKNEKKFLLTDNLTQSKLVVILSMFDNSCEFHIIKEAFRIYWCSMQHIIDFLVREPVE